MPTPAAPEIHSGTVRAVQSSAGASTMVAVALLTDRTLPLRTPAATPSPPTPAGHLPLRATPVPEAPAVWLLGAALFGLVTITRRRVDPAPAAPLPAAAPIVAPLVPEPAREAVAPSSRSTTPTETDPATSSERLRPIPAPDPPCGGDLLPACPALAATAVPS